MNLIRKKGKDKDLLSITQLIEKFKEHYRMQQAAPTSSTANNSAFATLQGNSNSNTDSNGNSNSNSSSNSKWHRKCIYGLKHRYSDYYYIAKHKRPQG